MTGRTKKILFHLLIPIIGLMLSSWELRYPEGYKISSISTERKSTLSPTIHNYPPPYDYGDRTQLSAFILCLFLGFISAHHFYLKNRKVAFVQLSFCIIMILGFISASPLGGLIASLLGLALFGWVLADLLLICFGGLRGKSKRPLIPWD